MEILFDTLPLDIASNTSINILNGTVILPVAPIINVTTQIIVVFDTILTSSTTITVSDGVSSTFITVEAGKNYGIGYYTPTSSGTKNFVISHIGQTNINYSNSVSNVDVGNKIDTIDYTDPEIFLERPIGKKFDGSINKIVSV